MNSISIPSQKKFEPVEYLVVGHVTKDIILDGYHLGGTASYAALTARALGKKVGIVTSAAPDIDFSLFRGLEIALETSAVSTTFENIQTVNGRIQTIHAQAKYLDIKSIPPEWINTPVVHLGPVANEIDMDVIKAFPNALIGLTPQGWMRTWDKQGHVKSGEWKYDPELIRRSSAIVLSIEDVRGNEKIIDALASLTPVLVVTEGPAGARVYWNGDLRFVKAHRHIEKDPTGAGDIFATAFFIRLHHTKDVWEAARFATVLASHSVNRVGLEGVPKPNEIQTAEEQIVKMW